MSKNIPIPPTPKLDIPQNFNPIDDKEFKKTTAYQKHVAPALARYKHQKRDSRIMWLKNEWLNLLTCALTALTLIATIIFGVLSLMR